MFDGCAYKEDERPSTVRPIQASFDKQLSTLKEVISQQLDGYPKEFIGVMCPRNESLTVVANELSAAFPGKVMTQRPGQYQRFDPSAPIVCSTLHNGKGLEYTCVHILQAQTLRGMPKNRELIYTGVTRARTSLSIYYDGALLGYLADALAADGPPAAAPSIDSLFE